MVGQGIGPTRVGENPQHDGEPDEQQPPGAQSDEPEATRQQHSEAQVEGDAYLPLADEPAGEGTQRAFAFVGIRPFAVVDEVVGDVTGYLRRYRYHDEEQCAQYIDGAERGCVEDGYKH